jgi:DNA invertase Pin-like site-specific DNA recombinase
VKAAIYIRVSTKEQTAGNQRPALEQYAQNRGFDIVAVYSEEESAWRAGHQIELAQLYTDAKKGKFQLVLVWALDRLTREGALGILKIVQRFKEVGVRIYSLQEPWTEAPGELAELLYAITGWVANMESKRRSERVRAGMDRLKTEGKIYHRPKGSVDKKKRVRRYFKKRLVLGGI